jgi:hypothetical protein
VIQRPRAIPCATANRWRVTAVSPGNGRIAAQRLHDDTIAVFDTDYVREHIAHGYAVTVHSAQGTTADTTHAVLSETATRSLFYVAMTRGREANGAYIYQRTAENEYQDESTQVSHFVARGSSEHAGRLLRSIVADDQELMTAHDLAAAAAAAHVSLPSCIRGAIDQRKSAIRKRTTDHGRWRVGAATSDGMLHEGRDCDMALGRLIDDGLEL